MYAQPRPSCKISLWWRCAAAFGWAKEALPDSGGRGGPLIASRHGPRQTWIQAQQAKGGIRSPPKPSDSEATESLPSQAIPAKKEKEKERRGRLSLSPSPPSPPSPFVRGPKRRRTTPWRYRIGTWQRPWQSPFPATSRRSRSSAS